MASHRRPGSDSYCIEDVLVEFCFMYVKPIIRHDRMIKLRHTPGPVNVSSLSSTLRDKIGIWGIDLKFAIKLIKEARRFPCPDLSS